MQTSIRIAEASEKHIVDDLVQLYLKEIQSFEIKISSSKGQLIYPYLDHYWQNPKRSPFLIFKEQQVAGFSLVRADTDPSNGVPVTEISEFFILNIDKRATENIKNDTFKCSSNFRLVSPGSGTFAPTF